MIAFAAAIQFLLVSPAFIRRPFTPQELGRATGFYPLVGLLLGALLTLSDFLLGHLWSVQVCSVLVLGLWIALTGALHFDGFLDTCDGLFGGTTPQRRLEIMRDARTGAFGFAAGALMLLTMFSSLNALAHARWASLLLAPVLGRLGMTLAIVAFPYARPAGLGKDIKDHARRPEAVAATFTALAVVAALTLVLRSYAPLFACVAAALVWWLSARFILRRIPGMTGDTYGALNMLLETAVLLTFAASL